VARGKWVTSRKTDSRGEEIQQRELYKGKAGRKKRGQAELAAGTGKENNPLRNRGEH